MDTLLNFDQWLLLKLNGSNSLFWDGFMWIVTQTSTWIPLLLMLLYVVVKNNNWKNVLFFVLFMSLSVLFADQVASSVFKPMVHRFRPTHDPSIMYMVDIVNGYRGGMYGFFSSHAANTFAIFSFVSLVIRYRPLSVSLFAWAFIDSYSRIYLGVHYPGDVLVGMVWGTVCGCLMYKAYVRFAEDIPDEGGLTSLQYTSTRYNLTDLYYLLCCLYFTFICIIIASFFMF